MQKTTSADSQEELKDKSNIVISPANLYFYLYVQKLEVLADAVVALGVAVDKVVDALEELDE